MSKLRKVFTPKVRASIYGVFGVVHVGVVFYHLVDDATWQVWENTVLGLFDIGVAALALSNTPGVTNAVVERGEHAAD